MKPLGRIGIGVDARIVRGERLHLVEAVLDRVGLRLITEMPLARKVGRVAVLLKKLGYGRRLLFERILIARSDHDRERRTDRNTSGYKRGAARRAACLTVPVRERRAFLGDPVDVWCWMAERGATPAIGAEIVPSSVIRHQHDDIWPLLLLCGRLRYRNQHRAEQCEHAVRNTLSDTHDCFLRFQRSVTCAKRMDMSQSCF